jgi:hypothetical protein
MIRTRRIAAALTAVALAGASSAAWAWEAPTTHAGLAEQAGQSSALHKRLVSIGFSQGLYESLTVPPADAPELLKALARMSPSQGYVPDARGRQYAIAWLAAGAAVADQPAAFAANHFYNVDTKGGLAGASIGFVAKMRALVQGRLGVGTLPRGIAAPDWVVSKDNPLGLDGFLDQYAKAIRAGTPGERSRAMAGALIAAGAIVHVLGDLGAPSRVRGDAAAHLEKLGAGRDDLGSRFERIAALAYGRLGVPTPSRVVTRSTLRGYFTNQDAKEPGLAEWVADRFFSPGTLPEDTRIPASGSVKPTLARPLPALPARLNLMAAGQEGGTTLKNDAGTCLARYHVDDGELRFDLDDDCLLEQVAVILPEVAAYETGLLDFLFRGELSVTFTSGRVHASATGALGAGELEILAEDSRGVRTSVAKAQVTKADDGASLAAAVAAPAGAALLLAVFTGVDANGERIVAVGSVAAK